MHPVIDGVIQLSDEIASRGLSVENIKTVQLRVNPEVLILTGKTNPQTGLEGKFSIFHAAAIGLLYREATPSQFTTDAVKNSALVHMRKKIKVTEDKAVSKAEAYTNVELDDGTSLEKHIEHARGSIQNPLTDGELHKKFMGQATLAIGQERANANKALVGIQDMNDVALIGQMY